MQNLKIHIDRLRAEETLPLNEALPPTALDVHDPELLFQEPIDVTGKVYLADDHLLIHLNLHTVALIPCCMCNEMVSTPITLKNGCITKPLSEIPTTVFDLIAEIRETLLLQVPHFVECSGGKCPERERMKKFFTHDEGPHFPFGDLTN